MTDRILAIGSHPDDIEFGCGGTLAKHMELGDEVFVIIMTNGENGNHPLNRKECLKSLKIMGIKKSNIFFGNFPDGNLQDNREVVVFIEGIIKKFNINKVYTHFPGDRHQDHRNCSNAVSSAARTVPEIFLFEGPSTNVTFEPHYFIELSDEQMKKKIFSLKCYKSQMKKRNLNVEWVENLAKVYSLKSGANYSEAFAINHILRRGKDV